MRREGQRPEMNDNDIIIPIGIPLGIYNNAGAVQNGGKIITLYPAAYACWFRGFFAFDIAQWCEACIRENGIAGRKDCLEILDQLCNAGLAAFLCPGEADRFLESAGDCAAVRQGIYYREDPEELTFSFGNDFVRLPNVPEIKLIWMTADGKQTLNEILSGIKSELLQDKENLEKIMEVLLKNNLLLLERKK